MATLSFGTPPAKIWIPMKGASRNVHIPENKIIGQLFYMQRILLLFAF